jgi:hypothetical protein
MERRTFLNATCQGLALAGLGYGARSASGATVPSLNDSLASRLKGTAEHVISIWLGGGMGQIDTFDPKRQGDPKNKQPGGYYRSIETSVPGVMLCEHLPRLAERMEQITVVRTVHHNVIDEHAAATNRMHTGRPVSGTTIYPSLGSVVAHQLGPAAEKAPPYVVVGYPNVTRGPGFLGTKANYLYLTDTNQGPAGLIRPQSVSEARQDRRDALVRNLRASRRGIPDGAEAEYEAAIEQVRQLGDSDFMQSFALKDEADALRERYGGEFGQRCLLARRMVQRGVRFIEVAHNLNFLNGSGWDVHNEGILQQHALIQELDIAMSALIDDLRNCRLLDKTLIMITTEFGRPPDFDSGGGRGHQGSAFSCVLAGGGLKHCGAFGETDELSRKIVADPVSVPDLFATVHAWLGIDWMKNLYDGDRPVPITDQGIPIERLF